MLLVEEPKRNSDHANDNRIINVALELQHTHPDHTGPDGLE